MRINYRPILIAAALLVPLGGLFYYRFSGFSGDLAFARLELKGNTYQRPLERLLRLLPEHERLALGALSGDQAAAAAVEAQAAEIDRAFVALGEVDQAVGKELQFTEEGLRKRRRESLLIPKVRARWVALKNISAGRDPEACRSAHDALLSDLRNCIAHVGDTSNLILELELDTYYLVDVTLGVLPGNQERLAHILEFGSQAGATDAAQLRDSDVDRATASLQTSVNETAALRSDSNTLHAAIGGPLQTYRAAADELLALLSRQATNAAPMAASQELPQKAAALRIASFTLWEASVDQLDRLLRARINGILAKRNKACLVVGLFLLGAGFVFWIFEEFSGWVGVEGEKAFRVKTLGAT